MVRAYRNLLDNGYWGLVAYEKIDPGTIILQEEPLVYVDLPTPFTQWSSDAEQQFYKEEHDEDSQFIKKARKKLSKSQRDVFRQIQTHSPCWRKDRQDVSRFQIHARSFP
ncbi:hypothetical protein EK21DRAFT_107918 [Setomelanomma holmii]|uniref:Uncharacterized protein n=1 Tax=Setomelanomma holmii TaxID=210430 RepID=A0A9P4HJP0_9PLEO|nr:hypothetical protein EK21DRAFT_107918 [Setomelanomma holmii]